MGMGLTVDHLSDLTVEGTTYTHKKRLTPHSSCASHRIHVQPIDAKVTFLPVNLQESKDQASDLCCF